MLGSEERTALAEAVGTEGELRFEEPMSRHTTLRIGGPAEAWIAPTTVECTERIVAACHRLGLPCRALGAGSNLLVLDGGVRGVLLASERLRGLSFRDVDPAEGGGAVVRVEAGVSTGKLLVEATRRSLGGVEFLGGVPGSVGGGMIMNAGTYLGEFKDVALCVETVTPSGERKRRSNAECGFVYRGSALPPDEIVVAAELRLPPRPRSEIETVVRALRDRRREREPHGFPNAGSFFKNPPGDFAGRLIEACGLKGTRIGGAEVATAHANWILNREGARASEVLSLIAKVRDVVKERYGIALELEVKLLGEPS
jgi:UDP-N-acetylmuramate dehydrogenase